MRQITSVLLFSLSTLAACQAVEPTGRATPQALGLTEGGGPVTLTSGNNNDWSHAYCASDGGLCRLTGDVSGSILTGLDEAFYGDRNIGVWLWNEGPYPITVAHEHTGSSLHNRFHLRSGADVVLPTGYGILVEALADWSTDPYVPAGWHEVGFHAVDNVVTSTPSRSLGNAFRPSTSTKTLVTYSASADCTITLATGQEGRVELLSDSANPPTTIRADVTGCKNTGTAVVGMNVVVGSRGTASYMVPIGDYVLLRSVNVTSTPSYAITRQTEQSL